MIDTMDTIPSYKDYRFSGDDWIDLIPAHWRSTSLGAISTRKSLRNRPDLHLLSVLREKGVVLRSSLSQDENHNYIPDDLSNYQVANEGDLVVNKMKAWQGSVGIAPQDGIVSPAYYIFELAGIKKNYAHRLLRSRLYADFFGRASDGVRIGQWDLGIPAMKSIPVMIPPPDEQDAIARYLDEMDRRVARFIRNRRRLIEVLKEKKQRLTQSAITSSSTKMHRMRDLVNDPKRKVERVESQEYRPIGLYNWGRGIFHKPPTRSQDLGDSIFFWVEEGDLIFSGQFAWEGAVSLARRKDHCCIASHRYPVFISKTASVRTSYLESFFQSSAGQSLMEVNSRGAAGRNRPLNTRSLLHEMIPVPSIDEQLEIEEFSNHLQRISDIFGRQIDLIREYRTRLISDVVTGKVDVRHLAPPAGSEGTEEMTDELEPLDEATGELGEDAFAGKVDV